MKQRIRTVKPEFFAHEVLFDAEKETGLPLRLAFIGLWSCCDREGRFEWRPRPLKSYIMPYDDVDFSRVLDALASRGFVVKYASDGREYGCVPSWKRHQVINNRETPSELPENGDVIDVNELLTREPRVTDASLTCTSGREGKGRELEGKGERAKALLSPSDDNGPSFDEFWNRFGNKTAKPNAQKAWAKMKSADRIAAFDASLGWLDRWKVSHPGASPLHPATFLNNRRWEDEQQQPSFNSYSPGFANARSGQQPGGLVGAAIRRNSQQESRDEGWG